MNQATPEAEQRNPADSLMVEADGQWPDAVIFDFNGTLSNDESVLLQVFTELFALHLGWSMDESYYQRFFLGRSDRETIEGAVAMIRAPDVELVDCLLNERRLRYRELVAETSTIPAQAEDLVHRLEAAEVPLAIVTGAQRADVDFVLSLSGIAGSFRSVVCQDDVTVGKPDPQGLRLATAALGVDPRRQSVVVLEDSVPGARAAVAAGMRCVGVLGSCDRAVLAPEVETVVDNLDLDVLPILLRGAGRRPEWP